MDRFRFGIRPVAIFAGVIGALQSATWIAMAIVGITAYYCHMDLDSLPNALGSIFELTFFKVYFSGPCDQQITQTVNFESLTNLDYMKPSAVHGVIWAYLMLSFFWFISSVTLLTSVRQKYIRFANIFLFIWITLTSLISILDLSFGILFGLDYGTFMSAAFNVGLLGETIPSSGAVLLAAQAAAGVMMGVAFRGFLLWIVNVALVGYFFTQTLEITDFNRAQDNRAGGMDNFGYGQDKNTDGYGFSSSNQTRAAPMWFNQPENHRNTSSYPTIPHVETRNRPPPPPPPAQASRRDDDIVVMRNNNVVREINDRHSLNVTRRNEPNPDYSPPMPRHNNPYDRQRSMVKGSRF